MVFKLASVVFVLVAAISAQNIRVNGVGFPTGGGDFQYNSGIGSRQYQSGGSGFGTQVDLDPTGTSRQVQNGRVNGGGFGGGAPPFGGGSVNVNGRDYTGRNVNEPGLQINNSPGNYQYQ